MKNRFILLLFLSCIPWLVAAQDDEDPCKQTVDKKFEKLYKKARSLQNNGDRSGAQTIYRDILDEFPEYLDANYYYAMSYYYPIQRNNMNIENKSHALMAMEAFNRIHVICPTYRIIHNLYAARLAYFMENFSEALKFANVMLENPEDCKQEDLDELDFLVRRAKFYDKMLNNPVPFDPSPVYGISTKHDEYLATISPDGEQFYFTRRMPYSDPNNYFADNDAREFFCISNKGKDGRFPSGNPLPAPFNKSENEGSPSINSTNDYLIFAKMTPYKVGNSAYPNFDLYSSEFIDGEWTEPQSLGPMINLPNYYESQPSLSSDGQTLFFVSDRPSEQSKTEGGTTTLDIWYSVRNVNGGWEAPVNLGKTINTSGNEKSPFLHTDSKTLYFSSDAHPGMGGFDIFYSKLDDKNRWQPPVNIGHPINTEFDEVDFFVSLDGKMAYFSSNNLGTNDWNIYQFELYEEARPRNMVLIKGEVISDDGDLSNTVVEIRDTASKVIATSKVNEYSGKYAIAMEIQEEKPVEIIVNVKKPGHSFDTKLITMENIINGVAKSDAEVKTVATGKIYDLHDIHFGTNLHTLTLRSMRIIDLFVEFLKENPSVKAEIQGHTDDIGDDKANQVLSEKRAKSVYDYVISKGISTSRLRYKGYGEYSPIATNDTPEGRAKNRRTVFLIYEQ
ncbi:OmpA family protein [Bacteroidales bacterium OttesenSCG-928-B11]|nr:OmpA family protein [Bacteroidales bacterium OttesenSCG-928-E04]MDL2308558.1 OmpA family protein [Bacteroidales bacterium OttesenSCG-928-C03]MDL2311860.1 OmpA family protein [Bacteroidales bacterium OttesenSCG-928-B11]MDL2326526.1 OmpA family protein [Bacteroidales bacterium OttesenSCG-928-A14]